MSVLLLPLLTRGIGNDGFPLRFILSGSLHPSAGISARGWRGCGRTAVDIHSCVSKACQVDVCHTAVAAPLSLKRFAGCLPSPVLAHRARRKRHAQSQRHASDYVGSLLPRHVGCVDCDCVHHHREEPADFPRPQNESASRVPHCSKPSPHVWLILAPQASSASSLYLFCSWRQEDRRRRVSTSGLFLVEFRP